MKQVSMTLGANTLTIECGRVAKQANGAAYVRYGDTVVLATACSTNPARRNRFLSPYRRLSRVYLRRGKNPRRFLQARRTPDGKGDSYQPPD